MDSALLSDARHAAKLQRAATTVWFGTNPEPPKEGTVKVVLIARTVPNGIVVRTDGQWVMWTEKQVRDYMAQGWKLVVTL